MEHGDAQQLRVAEHHLDAVQDAAADPLPPVRHLPWLGAGVLSAAIIALALLAGPAFEYAEGIATQLFTPFGYVDAVLAGAGAGAP